MAKKQSSVIGSGTDDNDGKVHDSRSGSTIDAGANSSSGDGGSSGSSELGGLPIANPADVGSGAGSDAGSTDTGNGEKRGRGRPPGSGKGKRKPASSTAGKAAVNTGVEKLLYMIHLGLAQVASAPEMELSEDEAALLASSIQEVAKHYDTTFDPKYVAWAGLVGVAATIYGPRVVAAKFRRDTEKAQKQPTVSQPATQTPQNNGSNTGIVFNDDLVASAFSQSH